MKKLLFLIIIVLIVSFFYFLWLISTPVSVQKTPAYFMVETGETLEDVAKNLKESGLIKSSSAFKIYAKIRGWQGQLIAGNHLLDKNMSIRVIIRSLTSSDNLKNERSITIIEGWRIEEIANYLEANKIVSKKDFLNEVLTANWQDKYEFLAGIKAKTLEGFLFPDTYRIFLNATAEDIVKKMLDNFDSKLTAKMRDDISADGNNIFEVVTLASIIEKEVPQDKDKKLIADVFLKRLKDNIALQSDATINFITGKGQVQPTLDDLKINSPYNTYKYRGLPPGPIANPGLSSLAAAIYPTPNPYYYFLTTLDDGTVIYSRTYDEHLKNKAKYLN